MYAIKFLSQCNDPEASHSIRPSNSSEIRVFMASVAMGICLLFSGCGNNASPIWSGHKKSPDGHWIATAETIENAGFGSGDVETSVYVAQNSQPPIEILVFINDNGRPIGVTSVELSWKTPSHLDVTYKAGARLDFQVVKCAGLDISVHQ